MKQNYQAKLHNLSTSDTFSMPLTSTGCRHLAFGGPCIKLLSTIPWRKR